MCCDDSLPFSRRLPRVFALEGVDDRIGSQSANGYREVGGEASLMFFPLTRKKFADWEPVFPLFDVIVRMEWLSKRKFVIVCYEKVIRIPLEGDEILRVHGERTQGVVKTLMNTKVVEFRIDLVHGAMPVAKSLLSRPSKMQEIVENQLQELENKGYHQLQVHVDMSLSKGPHFEQDTTFCVYGDAFWVYTKCTSGFIGLNDTSLPKTVLSFGLSSVFLDDILPSQVEAQSEAFKQENALAERLPGLDQQMERKGDERKCTVALCLYGHSRLDDGSLTGLKRKPLEFEVGDRVLLRVSPWKGVVRFWKEGLRLPEELNSVHDNFHVSNLKKCLADANLHVPLNEIKVDKTLRFVKELVEIMDREIKKLKRRKIALVKVSRNLKTWTELTWEPEKDQMGIKYPQLFVDELFMPASKYQDVISSWSGDTVTPLILIRCSDALELWSKDSLLWISCVLCV
ncbi:hypothetical protein Tco_0986804 [Tanacetum coccineum]